MNKQKHNTLREKVRTVYTQIPVQGVYYNSRGRMEFTYKGPDGKVRKTYLDPMTSSAVVNGLVPKSGVIYRGGHGGGKTTMVEKVAHMLTGIPEKEITSAMIRGNDDQNVNTLLATLKLGKLIVHGEEEVKWRNFVTSYVKIMDEVNRFPPPAQNALFEILNRGRVEFIDQVYQISDFMAFATENPNDSGTYPLSRPFVDRFSFCVPAPQQPSASDQYLLAERPDDKLKELVVKPMMTLEELLEARKLISEDVKMSSDALIYAIYLTQAVSTCARGDDFDKSHNEIPVGERCKGCGFDTPVSICKMTQDGLSGRAFLDFQRWGKAYAWFLNAFSYKAVVEDKKGNKVEVDVAKPEVQLETLQTIAPYLMYHRIQPSETVISKDPYSGQKMKFLEAVVAKATGDYSTVKDALKEVPMVLRGEIAPGDSKINDIDKDLVVQYHFKPLVEEADRQEFRDLYSEIESEEMKGKKLEDIQGRLALSTELKPHAQKYLLSKAMEKARGVESI